MIFITVGTTDFDELIRTIDNLIEHEKLSPDCIAQIGTGTYIPKNIKYFRFARSLLPYYKKAELIISHGGALTIFECLQLKKKLIVVENPDVRGGHQWELPKELSKKMHLIWCKTITKLLDCIKKAQTTQLKEYISPECMIPEIILAVICGESS